MSFVNDEKTLSDVENVLKDYFAKNLDLELDSMIDSGEITLDTISEWSKEHLRTK
jgi:hypothetical protein